MWLQTKQNLQKVLERFGYWILVLGSNVLDIPWVSAHHRGPRQHLLKHKVSLLTHRHHCIYSCNNQQSSFQLVTLKCECVTLSEGGGLRPFTVTSYPYRSKRWSPNWVTCFCYRRGVAVSPNQSAELWGIQRTSMTTYGHTSFRWRKEEVIYRITRSSKRPCGNHGSQFQRLEWFYVCTKRHQAVGLKQCFLGNSENVPRFALFSHLPLMHISLATNPKSIWLKRLHHTDLSYA